MKKTIILVILLAAFSARGQSIDPDVLASTGNSFTAGGYTLDWTIGEFSVQTYQENAFYITEGFHQPNYQYEEVVDEQPADIDVVSANFKVYPNPVKDNLNIETSISEGYSIELRDLAGSLVYRSNTARQKEEIEMNFLNAGVYLLRIYNQHNVFKIIKIIKSN